MVFFVIFNIVSVNPLYYILIKEFLNLNLLKFRKILNLLFIASLTCESCGIYKTTNSINPGIIPR